MKLIIQLLYPPLIFFTLRYYGVGLNDVMYLKILPLVISTYVTLLMVISYLRENSFILKFAKRFSKKELSEDEITYIKNSTFFWIIVSLSNVVLHVAVLISSNEYYWVTYASFGWYFVFISAGVLQYLHRKFVFLKRVKNV